MRSSIASVKSSRDERPPRIRIPLQYAILWLAGLFLLASIGCRDLSNPALPAGTQDPDTYHSRAGGLMLAEAAQRQFKTAWVEMTIQSGVLTDELTTATISNGSVVDGRWLSTGFVLNRFYSQLHKLRGQARLARAVLAEYAPDLSPAVRGRLFAYEAYAEIWLADMFCSGIPLGTIDFQGDYTNRPPSTTDEVYAHAVTLFDSAFVLATDSVALQTLALVGKARALLAMARYGDAESAVATVQGSDAYRTSIAFVNEDGDNLFVFAGASVSDLEGENGLPFLTSGDPRTASSHKELKWGSQFKPTVFPDKYSGQDSTTIALVSHIDAQLVTAEAALQREEWGRWLSILNTLRTTGTYTQIDTVYTDSTNTTIRSIDTLWHAGVGGVAGLGPLTDPGTDEARVTLHFAERAAWLFVSGQRQGDLRRLVRKYKRNRDEVYPTGWYAMAAEGIYGPDIDVQIPAGEQRNPLFKGCLSRD